MIDFKIPQNSTLSHNVQVKPMVDIPTIQKESEESFSTFLASVPRPAFEIIKVGKM